MKVQEFLSISTQSILRFLEQNLPKTGGNDWWQKTVIEKLPQHQAKLADQNKFSELADFDLSALLTFLERNWRPITEYIHSLDYRRGLNLVIEVKNIRNHYAHEPSSGTLLDQKIRDVDSITRLLKMLNADEDVIKKGQELHLELIKNLLSISTTESIEKASVGKSKVEETNLNSQVLTEDNSQKGVPLHWLKAGTILDADILQRMSNATYVGIDFGTSTSVASIAIAGDGGEGLLTKSIDIRQIDELGREIHSHLVDTCLAWLNQRLLFGVGAARLKQQLVGNETIWTSFKMGLGVDLGPEYNRTALPDGEYEYTIEKPQHAAAIFLKLLCDGIREYVAKNKLPEKIYYTVTVPASFEANQRQDLFAALEFAGIPESEIRLMDEPNAAFLSYLIDMESRSSGSRFVDILQEKNLNIIVFDFGAGTCDISILEVGVSSESILSRNLGISKFWALGGDDIDKVIARNILLPQLCGSDKLEKYLFTITQLEQQVLPYLKPVAEALKIACCELAEQQGWKTIQDLRNTNNKIVVKPSVPFSVQGRQWEITEPQITLKEFADIMALFVGEVPKNKGVYEVNNVLEPIDNALEKVELTKDDINMVLFIGGSGEHPLIRHYVSQHLGRFVESITPIDLRAHVSQGAALYTLFFRGADIDPIRAIISENIYVLTCGENLIPLIKAGSLVPSDGELTDLVVTKNGQKTIDLPFFSGSANKPIGFVQIQAQKGGTGFKEGEKVRISWSYSKEKILHVEAEANNIKQTGNFQNPLANEEMTAELLAMLRAKQAFNKSVLEGRGRPSATVTLLYSNAASKAGHYRLAAEMLEATERLDPNVNHATSICYYYSKDGDYKSSDKWSKIAYERSPSALTSFNYALDQFRNDKVTEYEKLMQESIEFDPSYTATLVHYGKFLFGKGDALGAEYLQRAFDIFKEDMDSDELDASDIPRFRIVGEALGKEDLTPSLNTLQEKLNKTKSSRGYTNENLVGIESQPGNHTNTSGDN